MIVHVKPEAAIAGADGHWPHREPADHDMTDPQRGEACKADRIASRTLGATTSSSSEGSGFTWSLI
jgi:hypothetical protein